MQSFLFKPLCEDDFDLLYHWFQEPIINQWYARGKNWSYEDIKQKYLSRIQGKDNIPSFIIYKKECAIGFIQYYFLTEHFPEGIQDFSYPLFKSYQANELVGLDLFVAEQDNRGKGWGEQILSCFILELPINIRAIIVDPDSSNQQAICCYIKTGFQATNYSENKDHLLLLKSLSQVSEDS